MDVRDTKATIEAIREVRASLKRTVTRATWVRRRTEVEEANEADISAHQATTVLPLPAFYAIRRGKNA